MRLSAFPLNTLRETPADAEVISHQLMLRAGLIRRLASGLYIWMPIGLRVLRRVEAIVREEMNRAGAFELMMPAVQPAELWQESGRWQQYGAELLRFRDRHEREFCFGPTHEEVITEIARRELHSYKQLPVNYYQIQTKFRDEIRPRFGVMRSREFVMKDAYSFHPDEASLEKGYLTMRDAYTRIFQRLGLNFRVVQADSGNIGGRRSEEFHVLARSGEDVIAYCEEDGYAANLELAPAPAPAGSRPAAGRGLERISTPDVRSIAELSDYLQVPPDQCVKTLLVAGVDGRPVALVLRGDHELNALKAERLDAVAAPLRMCSPGEVREATGAPPGFAGPVGLDVPVVVDHAAAALADFVCGANSPDAHLVGCNWERDLPLGETADLRNAVEGDPSPDGGGPLRLTRGIEVGHIFQLGRKYSDSMDATILDESGRDVSMEMGCYGIGISRVVAAAIEQNHDDRGIIWPAAMAPFDVALVPLNAERSPRVAALAESLYRDLSEAGVAVVLDDRPARPGVKFADMELLGIPHRVVVGERGLDRGELEYRYRGSDATEALPLETATQALLRLITPSDAGQRQ